MTTILERYIKAFDGIDDIKAEYKKYVIGYIDLLGIHEILKIDTGDALISLNKLYNRLIRYTNQPDNFFKLNNIQIKIFSDNIVIASEIDGNNLNKSFQQVSRLSKILQEEALLRYGWLLRGGICIGDLYIDDVFNIGSGLITAYQLESSLANYPRIIIDKQLINTINVDMFKMPYGLEEIYQDHDGEYYINYLSSLNKDSIYNSCSHLRQYFGDKVNTELNKKIKQKYNWQLRYIDRVIEWVDLNLKTSSK